MMQILLLTTLLILPLTVLIGLAAFPARWNKVIFVVAALSVIMAWSVFRSSPDEMLPLSFFIKLFQIIALLLAFALGFAIRWAWRRPANGGFRPNDSTPRQPEKTVFPDAVFGFLLAFWTPVVLSYNGAFGRWDGAILFSLLAIILIALVAVSVVGYRAAKLTQFVTSMSCAVSIAAVAAYAVKTGLDVQSAARKTANGQPFCIQSGNAPVDNILGLSFLTLRAPRTDYSYLNYHGLLVVKQQESALYYNWSYWFQDFLPAKMIYTPDVICAPKPVTP